MRVTYLQPRVTVATKYSEPDLAPAPKFPTEIQPCFNLADAITGETGIAAKCINVELLKGDSRCDKVSRTPAERLIELRIKQRISSDLQVGTPLGVTRIDGSARQAGGYIERGRALEVIFKRNSKLQKIRSPTLRSGFEFDSRCIFLLNEAVGDLLISPETI